MDLEYQSHPNIDIDKQLNRLDKLNSKLALTIKDLPASDLLLQPLKDKLVTSISNDQTRNLLKLLDKQVISWNRQIGAKGTRWNVLHLCAKFNAVNSTRTILKKLYQAEPEQYTKAVNTPTSQGFTPLMIAIIYRGDKVLELLLQLGGVDLSIIERGKLRAYDLALHYRNQHAISQLIVYEDRCRKKPFLNQLELLSPEPLLQQKMSVCESIANYLVDCLICFKFDDQQNGHNMFAKVAPLFKKEGNIPIDPVKVGSRKDIEDYQIQWKRLSTINGQKIALFDSFKPQDICQSQFSLKNSLILLQTLSDFPWLLRKIITRIQTAAGAPQNYGVILYHNCQATKIQVDQFVPIVRERGEPMFLSNRSQIWPMILQKAMAKLYGSYLTLNSLTPTEALQSITGFYVKQLSLSSLNSPNGIVSSFQELSLRGYLVLLQGRPRTDLNSSSQATSYAILNYYQKGDTRKLLVNCPNIVQKWRDGKENRQLAILKAHFSRHNQSCLWIDQNKLDYYFTHAIVVFLKEGCTRSDLKMKLKIKNENEKSIAQIKDSKNLVPKQYTKSIFFKIKIQKPRDQPVLMQLTDLQNRHRFDLSKLQGWKNQGSQIMICQEEHPACPQLVKFTCSPGQYLCKFDLKAQRITQCKSGVQPNRGIIRKKDNQEQIAQCRKKVQLNLGPEHLRQLQLAVWAPQQVQLQLLQQSFGTIEWLAHYRSFVSKNWAQMAGREHKFLTQTVNGKTIVVAKRNGNKSICLVLPTDSIGSDSILQGKWRQQGLQVRIQMLIEGNCDYAYCVLIGVNIQSIKDIKISAQSP